MSSFETPEKPRSRREPAEDLSRPPAIVQQKTASAASLVGAAPYAAAGRATPSGGLPYGLLLQRKAQDGPALDDDETQVERSSEEEALEMESEVQQKRSGAAVQRRGGGGRSVHEVAAAGVRSGGGALPHLGAIQQSFGRHDVSGVQAHSAPAENRAMGADAYAMGNHVAFGGSPDLHTAAHEAAHVVQQRSGLQLPGGVGKAGDSHEQHADAVASAVTQGRSAEGLLNRYAGGGGGGGVQRKETPDNLKVKKGQMTFNVEGSDNPKSRYFSRRPHWPGGASGVTIGRGYDMKFRTEQSVYLDLTGAGVPKGDAEKLKKGAKLTKTAAKNFCSQNKGVVISHAAQKELFYIALRQEENVAKSLVRKWTGDSKLWAKLDPTVRDMTIDLKYRGDLIKSRAVDYGFVSKIWKKNDTALLLKVMRDRSKWSKVPAWRFAERVWFVEDALGFGRTSYDTALLNKNQVKVLKTGTKATEKSTTKKKTPTTKTKKTTTDKKTTAPDGAWLKKAVAYNDKQSYSKAVWCLIQANVGLRGGDIDGDPGPTTARYVRAFQEKKPLEDIDGKVGPTTYEHVRAAGPVPSSIFSIAETFGAAVRYLKKLGLVTGPTTKATKATKTTKATPKKKGVAPGKGSFKRPHGYKQIVQVFGQPGDGSKMAVFSMRAGPGGKKKNVYCHKKVGPLLQSVFESIHKAGDSGYIKSFDGCFNKRRKRGGKGWSTHSWAIAVDVNARDNPMISRKHKDYKTKKYGTKGNQALNKHFEKHGFYWGAAFGDPMHWQYCTGY